MSDFLTVGEFERFRMDLGGRLDRLEEKIDAGFLNLNGRTRAQAEAIVALDARVETIAKRGCAQYDKHREFIEALGSPGMTKGKQVGVVAGAGAGVVGLIEIVRAAVVHFWK